MLLVGLCVFSGCAPDKGEYKISGSVTLEGEPIEVGTIRFSGVDGATHVGGGKIKDGKYEASVPPGEKIVKIAGYKVKGQTEVKDDLTGEVTVRDDLERCTPVDYERESPLRVTIEKEGEVHDFDLKSEL